MKFIETHNGAFVNIERANFIHVENCKIIAFFWLEVEDLGIKDRVKESFYVIKEGFKSDYDAKEYLRDMMKSIH